MNVNRRNYIAYKTKQPFDIHACPEYLIKQGQQSKIKRGLFVKGGHAGLTEMRIPEGTKTICKIFAYTDVKHSIHKHSVLYELGNNNSNHNGKGEYPERKRL